MLSLQPEDHNKSSQTSPSHSPRPLASNNDQSIQDASQPKYMSTESRVHLSNISEKPNLDNKKLTGDSALPDHLVERRFPSSVDSDKKDQLSPPFQPYPPPTVGILTTLPSPIPMPHRVESLSMSTTHHRQYESSHHPPSPPPITTLNNSNSPSLSVSSISTPPPRESPPQRQSSMYSSYHSDVSGRSHQNQYTAGSGNINQSYNYSSHAAYGRSDSANYPNHTGYQVSSMPQNSHSHLPTAHSSSIRDAYASQYPVPGQNNMAIIHTDDAATKLSDRVRRRCFNCCTTDTSTWRRSNLSPGKVLCNKCGLFERTHSRPRPEQFPHKRGPLATSTLRGRSPPPTHLPPLNAHSLPPYHYNHPSIAPLSSATEPRRQYHSNPQPTLPEIQSWLNEPTSHAMQPPTARRPMEPGQHTRQSTPPSARPQQQHSALEARDQPNGHE